MAPGIIKVSTRGARSPSSTPTCPYDAPCRFPRNTSSGEAALCSRPSTPTISTATRRWTRSTAARTPSVWSPGSRLAPSALRQEAGRPPLIARDGTNRLVFAIIQQKPLKGAPWMKISTAERKRRLSPTNVSCRNAVPMSAPNGGKRNTGKIRIPCLRICVVNTPYPRHVKKFPHWPSPPTNGPTVNVRGT